MIGIFDKSRKCLTSMIYKRRSKIYEKNHSKGNSKSQKIKLTFLKYEQVK